jgi:hypothetical protein
MPAAVRLIAIVVDVEQRRRRRVRVLRPGKAHALRETPLQRGLATKTHDDT